MAQLINWYRHKPKLVRGSTAGAQIDYQLKLTIYKGSGTDIIINAPPYSFGPVTHTEDSTSVTFYNVLT